MATKEVETKAPKDKFRLTLVDIGVADGFTGGPDDPCSFLIGDYNTLEEAKEMYFKRDGHGVVLYIYDDKGECVFDEFKAMDEPKPPQILTIEIEEIEPDNKYRGTIKGFTLSGWNIGFEFEAPMAKCEAVMTEAASFEEAVSFIDNSYTLRLMVEGEAVQDPRLTPEMIHGFFFSPISMAASLLIDERIKGKGNKGSFQIPIVTKEFLDQLESPEDLIKYVCDLNR